MLTKTDHKDNYLDSRNWNLAPTTESVAYLQRVHLAYTFPDRKPYLSLLLKDVNGAQVSAVMFNFDTENYDANDLIALRRKPVKVTYNVKVYNGSYNLKVFEILPYGESFPYELFLGEVPQAMERLELINKKLVEMIGEELPLNMATTTYTSISEGRIGGFVNLAWSLYRGVSEYVELSGCDRKDMFRLMTAGLIYLSEYTKLTEETDNAHPFILHKLKSDLIATEDGELDFNASFVELCDAISLGITPKTFPALLIYRELVHAQAMYSAAYVYANLVDGASTTVKVKGVDDIFLTKY